MPWSGKGSWYSQLPEYGWRDTGDKPGSNALGVPDEEQGIALPSRKTLGQWFDVKGPDGKVHRVQQTDVGPAGWTGRGIDISAAAAHKMGYTPKTFPTDAKFEWEPASGDAPEQSASGSPAGSPQQAEDVETGSVAQGNRRMADDAGLLTRLGYQPQEQMGGILGGMEGKLPYLAMIAKGLSPYSDLDPMSLMKLAQAQQERAAANAFRQQQLDLNRRGVDREDAQFKYRQDELEAARQQDANAFRMFQGGGAVNGPAPTMDGYDTGGGSPAGLPQQASEIPQQVQPTDVADPDAPKSGMTRENIMRAFELYPKMGETTRRMFLNELQKIEQREEKRGEAARTRKDREELAAQVGAEKGSKAYTDIMLGAKGTKPEVSATDARSIAKAEDELPSMRGTLENLKEALDLTPQSYEGLTANIRGYIGARIPELPGGDKTAANATDRLSQILNSTAIRDMSRTMKGATSDREMNKWLMNAADLSRPIKTREQDLKRAIALYEDEIQTREKRIDQLRGGDYYKPQGGQSKRDAPDPLGIR